MLVERCVVCGSPRQPYVYISGGGTHVHVRPDCPALLRGQEKVRLRGGQVADIDAVRPTHPDVKARDLCEVCRRWEPGH